MLWFLSFCADRPCLEDSGRVQRVQRSVELGLTHILHRDNLEGLLPKVQCLSIEQMLSVHSSHLAKG